jgi:hypothetical protein
MRGDHSEAAIFDSIGDEGVAENLLNAMCG